MNEGITGQGHRRHQPHARKVTGDTNPMHTDAVHSAASLIGQRIAHGTLGMSIATGLSARMGQLDGTAIAALGVDQWKFHKPILFNDTVYLRTTVVEARVSSKPDRGVLTRKMELLNQNGELALGYRRSGSPAPMSRAA